MRLNIKKYKESLTNLDKRVIIIGKNHNLDKYMPLSFNDDDIVVCVNDIINFVDRCDWWVINHNIVSWLTDKGRNNVNKIFMPEFTREARVGWDGITHEEVLIDLNKDVDFIVYNGFWPPDPVLENLFYPGVVITVGDTALAFMLELGYRNIEFYGIGISQKYAEGIDGKETPQNQLIESIKGIIRRCDEVGGQYKFNF